jgi:hypothetical protein
VLPPYAQLRRRSLELNVVPVETQELGATQTRTPQNPHHGIDTFPFEGRHKQVHIMRSWRSPSGGVRIAARHLRQAGGVEVTGHQSATLCVGKRGAEPRERHLPRPGPARGRRF